MAKRPRVSGWRLGLQIFFFALIAIIAVGHTLEEAGGGLPLIAAASTHAICPFGGVVSIYQVATTGTYVKKIHESSFILMYIVFALALFMGPVFCGWVCPFGSFQEWTGRLGRKIFGKRYNNLIPYKVDRWLRYPSYGVLALVLYMTARTGLLMFANVDPYFALFNFWTGEVAITALIALGVVFLLSFLVERPFCKYACPYGAALGLFNLLRIFKIRRNPETCIDCKACDRSCPMNIPVSTSGVVRDHQCITCMKCTSEQSCPVNHTVELMAGGFAVSAGADRPAAQGEARS